MEAATKSAARAIGSTVGRQIVRGVLGSLLGGQQAINVVPNGLSRPSQQKARTGHPRFAYYLPLSRNRSPLLLHLLLFSSR